MKNNNPYNDAINVYYVLLSSLFNFQVIDIRCRLTLTRTTPNNTKLLTIIQRSVDTNEWL